MGKNARTFGQDLMRGEGGGMSKQRLTPGGGGGGAWLGGQATASSEKFGVEGGAEATGTSIFDPVMCELAYRWFSAPGMQVLDPFAGGSVRGVVASVLGRRYFGNELRPEQVAANEAQADICPDPKPVWHCGDSVNIREYFTGQADFLFSCPPYADLEVYSDDPPRHKRNGL